MPITVEQYECFEGYQGLREELINGEIVLSPQPKPLHQQIAKNINRLLDNALLGQGFTAQQSSNIRLRRANSMPSPDVFVTAVEDWKLACEQDDYLSAAPVLVVEIISPANRKKRVASKVELYLSEGVTQVWAIHLKSTHPKAKTVELISKARRSFGDDTIPLPEPLSGRIELAWVFAI
jgi:Uma2 family endonuclease